ncbi:MAG: PEP-CTERM sorting domain-containing protein [Pirellulales bacterium]
MLSLAVTASAAHPLPDNYFFQPPVNFGAPINTAFDESSPAIGNAGLLLVYSADGPGGFGDNDLWQSTRSSLSDPWGPPVNLGPQFNSSGRDSGPDISADGLVLTYHSERSGGLGDRDVWQATRTSVALPWNAPTNLGPPVNTSAREQGPSLSADGLTLIFDSTRGGGFGNADIWQATRSSTSADWSGVVNLGGVVNSSLSESSASLSPDGLTLIFTRNVGMSDLWMSRRESVESPWQSPDSLDGAINTNAFEESGILLDDNRTLVFRSTRPGGFGGEDLWTSTTREAATYTRFNEPSAGQTNFASAGGELGFATTILGETSGVNRQLGVVDDVGRHFRMRSINARTTIGPADLSQYVDVQVALDVRNSTTSWETGDFYRVELSNGFDTILMAERSGAAGLDPIEGGWSHYRAFVPNGWTSASIVFTSFTNSSAGDEYFDIDNIAFFGTYVVPEPSSYCMAILGAAMLVLRPSRRR